MTNLTDLQRRVLEIVTLHPKERPITGKEIANRVGLKPRDSGKEGADLRSVVHALRVKGFPICAHGRGYWYPKDGDELRAFIGSLEARATQVQEAVDGLKLGYTLVGQAKGQEEVKKAVKRRWRADGKVFEVRGDLEEKFHQDHPGAVLV